jgi:multicomponent Na+:H+ antiporter subunit A
MDFYPAFEINGLSRLMGLLIGVIGILVFVYATSYMKGVARRGSLYLYLALFMASMLGLVFSSNLLTLFIFWELTSVCSYLLIGFKHESRESRDSALQAFLVTGVGALALLAGIVMLGNFAGTFEIAELARKSAEIRASALYPWILGLVLLGAFTKSAQFPFHFWLPNAMAAPTPVSAYLHSATMVKAGIFLMARLNPVLGGTPLWVSVLVVAGSLTALTGCLLALAQSDLKKVLAYTTVSALGTLTLLLGLGTPKAIEAFVAFLVAHALYKASLFMLVGAIDHETGTRDLTRLTGLGRPMPRTALLVALASLAMAGLPPTFSFMAKELALEAAIGAPDGTLGGVALLGLLAGACVFVYLGLILARSLFSSGRAAWPASALPQEPHEAPFGMLLGPALLVLSGVVLGIRPGLFVDTFVEPAVAEILQDSKELKFSLWHGLSLPLLLTLGVLLVGAGLYRLRSRVLDLASGVLRKTAWGPETLYGDFVKSLPARAQNFFDRIQNGSLRFYLGVVLMFTLLFVSAPLLGGWDLRLPARVWQNVRPEDLIVSFALLSGAFLTILSKKTFVSLASTGMIGLGVAAYYVFYGAPDLAITQLLVESLSLILVILVLFHFSRDRIPLRLPSKGIAVLLSTGMGALFTVFLLLSLGNRYFDPISHYHRQNSLPLGKGSNVVNVILVDFRGWDTMGEITVLALATIGVYAMLRWMKGARDVTK